MKLALPDPLPRFRSRVLTVSIRPRGVGKGFYQSPSRPTWASAIRFSGVVVHATYSWR